MRAPIAGSTNATMKLKLSVSCFCPHSAASSLAAWPCRPSGLACVWSAAVAQRPGAPTWCMCLPRKLGYLSCSHCRGAPAATAVSRQRCRRGLGAAGHAVQAIRQAGSYNVQRLMHRVQVCCGDTGHYARALPCRRCRRTGMLAGQRRQGPGTAATVPVLCVVPQAVRDSDKLPTDPKHQRQCCNTMLCWCRSSGLVARSLQCDAARQTVDRTSTQPLCLGSRCMMHESHPAAAQQLPATCWLRVGAEDVRRCSPCSVLNFSADCFWEAMPLPAPLPDCA